MSQWYYSKAGQRQGPVSEEQLRQLAATGQLQPGDLIWKEGMSQWTAASSITGLFAAPQAAPPLLPNTSPAKPAPGVFPRGFYSWLVIAAFLLCCFPIGLGLVWTHPVWTRRQKMIWSGVWLALVVTGYVHTVSQQAANKARITQAHQLWTSGDKAKAIAKYRAAIDTGIAYIATDDRSLVVTRVVDYDVENGLAEEAKSIIAKSSKEHVAVRPETVAGKALLAQVEEEQKREEEQEHKHLAQLKKKSEQNTSPAMSISAAKLVEDYKDIPSAAAWWRVLVATW